MHWANISFWWTSPNKERTYKESTYSFRRPVPQIFKEWNLLSGNKITRKTTSCGLFIIYALWAQTYFAICEEAYINRFVPLVSYPNTMLPCLQPIYDHDVQVSSKYDGKKVEALIQTIFCKFHKKYSRDNYQNGDFY